MYAVEFLMERLEEQKALGLTENTKAGGRVVDMVDRLKEGIGSANHIPSLKAVEAGRSRYVKALSAALVHVEKLGPVLTRAATIAGATYADGAQREKAMAQLKDTPKQLANICDAAIAELKNGLRVLEEGDAKQTKLAGAAA